MPIISYAYNFSRYLYIKRYQFTLKGDSFLHKPTCVECILYQFISIFSHTEPKRSFDQQKWHGLKLWLWWKHKQFLLHVNNSDVRETMTLQFSWVIITRKHVNKMAKNIRLAVTMAVMGNGEKEWFKAWESVGIIPFTSIHVVADGRISAFFFFFF